MEDLLYNNNLEAITINGFIYHKQYLKFNSPYVIHVVYDSGYFVAKDDKLGLYAFALSQKVLVKELKRNLRVVWQEYALADDEILSPCAKLLKQSLLSMVTKRSE